jgi:hypothetical protein
LAGLRIRYERDGKYISTDEKSAGKNQQAFLLPLFLWRKPGSSAFKNRQELPAPVVTGVATFYLLREKIWRERGRDFVNPALPPF